MSKFVYFRRILELSKFSPLEFDKGGSQILIAIPIRGERKNILWRQMIVDKLRFSIDFKGAAKSYSHSSCEKGAVNYSLAALLY